LGPMVIPSGNRADRIPASVYEGRPHDPGAARLRQKTLICLAFLAVCQVYFPARAESQAQTPSVTFAASPLTAVLVLTGDASGKTLAVPDASQPKNKQWQVPVNLKEVAEASLLADMHQRFTSVQEAPTLGVVPRGLADLIVVIDVRDSSYITHYSLGFSPGTATISFLVTFTAIAKTGGQLAKTVTVSGVMAFPKPYALGPMDWAQIPALFKTKLEEAFIGFIDSPETYAFIGNLRDGPPGSQPTNVTASQPYSGPTIGNHAAAGKNNNDPPPEDIVGTTQESPAQTTPRSAKNGDAHDCIRKGAAPNNGGNYPATLTVETTCADEVIVSFCAKNPRSEWRCDSHILSSTQRGYNLAEWGDECDTATCSEWTLEWNAIYNYSGAVRPPYPHKQEAKVAH
jgi:hypothetical protein